MKHKHQKIALYDPSGSGGITQYTFGLAEELSKVYWKVTLITSEDYELQHLHRSFEVWFLFRRSRLKSWVAPLGRLVSRWSSEPSDPPSQHGVTPTKGGAATGRLMGHLKTIRYTLILFKAAVWLYLSGTRVVHFQWLIDRKADLFFIRLLRLLGLSVVYTAHDLLPHDEYTAENRSFYQGLYQYPDKLILHSESNRREMLELFDVDPEKLCVIPSGSLNVCFDHPGSSTSNRRRLGIPEHTRVILFFGLIKRYKGLEYLLDAFQTIDARCSNVMLLIVGTIANRDPATHQHYTRLLAQCSGHRNIKFVNEYVPVNQIADYFNAADLVVLPHVKASQSGVLMAAYAAGKPVVVTDSGGLGEVVRNSDSGLVVPPRDADAIAEAVITMLDNPDCRRALGVNAKTSGETTYSWATIAATTADLYRVVIEKMPRSDAFPAPRTP